MRLAPVVLFFYRVWGLLTTRSFEDAVAQGARIVNPQGGTINGSFFYPAILYPVTQGMRVYQEEQFGIRAVERRTPDVELNRVRPRLVANRY